MITDIQNRSYWPRWLMAVNRDKLVECYEQLETQMNWQSLSLPQNGLALLPVQDSAFHDLFNLGEIPLSKVHLRIEKMDGNHKQETEGAAWLMSDDMPLVEAIAFADALLAAGWSESAVFEDLLAEGKAIIEAQTSARRAILAATNVDFSLLAQAEEDDERE